MPANLYGAPTLRADGSRINYARAELNAQAGAAVAAPERPAGAPAGSAVPAVWSYAVFGTGIGYSNILIGRNAGAAEIYLAGSTWTFGLDTYWYALRYTPATGNYDQIFVSEKLPAAIVRMALADVAGDGRNEIVLALESGEILIYDQQSRKRLPGFSTIAGLTAMIARDLDGDGKAEIIVTTESSLSVYSGSGTPLWSLAGVGGHDIAVGQMDLDPALEIATTSGDVVDAVTHAVQWHWPDGFGYAVRAGDIDGDGIDELVAASGWTFVWAYDVERQLPKWSLPASGQDIATIELADVDCDGRPDLIVGEGQWGSIKAFDTVTQTLKWAIGNPYHGVTRIALGDVNGDGLEEVLWGSGATDSGPDHLYVADPGTQSIEWSSVDLVGPFVGPEVGDIDGDGQPEIVAVASLSDSGYGGSRIVVLDAKTRLVRAVSPAVGSGFFPVEDLRLRNVDADPALEIVLGTDYFYDGQATILKFDGATNSFTQIWSSTPPASNSPLYAVEVADVDADGALDVVAGGSGGNSFVYLYDAVTGALKWNSFQLGNGGIVRDVVVESAGGGHPDLLAIVQGGSLYAFDGVTKEALQITPGTFTSMTANAGSGTRSVFLGDQSGGVYRYDRGASTYVLAATYPLGLEAIDGVTPLSGGGALVGAGGRLFFFPSLAGPPAWTSEDFGAPVGRRAVLGSGANARFFSGSATAIVEAAQGIDLVSVEPHSGPAGGGTTIMAAGSSFQPGAGLYVGGDPAANVEAAGATQIHGDTPSGLAGSLQSVLVLNPDSSFESLERGYFFDFQDVDAGSPFHDDVETIFRGGVTAGCGAGKYCPALAVTRAQMAAFLVRASRGEGFQPPKARGLVFSDVACGGFAANEIEWIAGLGVTAGCGGGAYCGSGPVTRQQMAAFLLKIVEGASYVPPPAQGIFADVPIDDPFAPWIEELSVRGITAGCGGGNFCPTLPTTRGQMAVFLARAFFGP